MSECFIKIDDELRFMFTTKQKGRGVRLVKVEFKKTVHIAGVIVGNCSQCSSQPAILSGSS
jgi:hypothetical protein